MSIQHPQIQHGKLILDRASVTAELVAILWALGSVEEVRTKDIVKCSDSAAALMAQKSGARPDFISRNPDCAERNN